MRSWSTMNPSHLQYDAPVGPSTGAAVDCRTRSQGEAATAPGSAPGTPGNTSSAPWVIRWSNGPSAKRMTPADRRAHGDAEEDRRVSAPLGERPDASGELVPGGVGQEPHSHQRRGIAGRRELGDHRQPHRREHQLARRSGGSTPPPSTASPPSPPSRPGGRPGRAGRSSPPARTNRGPSSARSRAPSRSRPAAAITQAKSGRQGEDEDRVHRLEPGGGDVVPQQLTDRWIGR